ncbi:hypothetical protein LL912_22815 [Niabella sp. CC-SYL272]|uniref:DUF6702 family protein n=1 Tax=Niabella agricola TaxID=2891571 RepID=UPI001F355E19|nr:DUF6702 family protein [Niabella agricola]MCF3111637.1 hypothetical protein [Niabella agricola]
MMPTIKYNLPSSYYIPLFVLMVRKNYKRKFILLLTVVILTGFSRPAWHPFHVSASEIEYNRKTQRLEISTKIFTDDFESVLTRIYKTPVDFSNKSRKLALDTLVTKYITTHLSIRSNGQLQRLKLFGWEVDHEAVYLYTMAEAVSFNPGDITVENTILYELFQDQMNIVHFIVNGTRKSSKLAYPERKLQFRF